MSKTIIHPGNGVTFPVYGQFVKFNLNVIKDNKNVINNLEQVIRYGFQSNLKKELENLIGEMSLLEKCAIEIKDDNYYNEEGVITKSNITYEIEIINISEKPLYAMNDD